MRAIIVSDAECRALLESLLLRKLEQVGRAQTDREREALEASHRAFYYVVCRWLQDMGAIVAPLG